MSQDTRDAVLWDRDISAMKSEGSGKSAVELMLEGVVVVSRGLRKLKGIKEPVGPREGCLFQEPLHFPHDQNSVACRIDLLTRCLASLVRWCAGASCPRVLSSGAPTR